MKLKFTSFSILFLSILRLQMRNRRYNMRVVWNRPFLSQVKLPHPFTGVQGYWFFDSLSFVERLILIQKLFKFNLREIRLKGDWIFWDGLPTPASYCVIGKVNEIVDPENVWIFKRNFAWSREEWMGHIESLGPCKLYTCIMFYLWKRSKPIHKFVSFPYL